MNILLPFVTLLVTFISSLLSGLAGGGGSFITAPYWLISGMSPAQGETTGAFMAIGMGASSGFAFHKTGHIPTDKRFIRILMAFTITASLIGPFFLNQINTAHFKPILAIVTLLALPLLFIKLDAKFLSRFGRRSGWIAMALILLASSFVTSSLFSILMTIVFIQTFHFTALQSIALRRIIGVVQSIILFIVLACLGNFIWQQAITGLLGGIFGGYVGTKFMLKRGELFAKYALAAVSILGIILLFI